MPGQRARLPVELDQRRVIGAAGSRRCRGTRTTAGGRPPRSRGLLHASRYMFAVGPPRSEMTPVKPGTSSRTRLDLAQDRRLGAVLDDAALVLGDRAEAAAAEAAAHDRDREPDHLVGRDLRVAVAAGAACACTAARRAVHLRRRQRQRRRVEPDVARRRGAGRARARCPGSTRRAGCATRARTAPDRPRPRRSRACG